MRRLRTWHERIRTEKAGERNLQFALPEVDRMASALGVPKSVRVPAAVVYRRALDGDLVRGRSIEGVATAALYAGGMLCDEKRTQAAVTEVADVTAVTIRNRYQEQLAALTAG
jgi:transcription initiation factor TFIIB